MFESIGHPVIRLTRIAIGPVRDAGLKSGQYRYLRPQEIRMFLLWGKKVATAKTAKTTKRKIEE